MRARPEISAIALQQALGETLEPLMDAHGLPALLDALALVCSEKGDHVRSNWQDERLARVWEDMAGQLLGVEFKARAKLP